MPCSARYESVYSSAAEEIRQSGLYDNQPRPSLGHGHSNPSALRNEYARDDEPAFPAEYHTPHDAGLYMPEHNQSYHDDPYGRQHQYESAGQGQYREQEGYGGQYAPDHEDGYGQGQGHGRVDGYGSAVSGYQEKGYAKEEGYEYAGQGQGHAPPGPQGGRWDQGGYR